MSKKFDPRHFFKLAFYFESSLILVALLVGWLVGVDPFLFLFFDWTAVGWGIAGTLPMFLLFLWFYRAEARSLREIKNVLLDTLAPQLHACRVYQLLLLAAVAGFSEELLFRGVLQVWLEGLGGSLFGLIASNILFGLVHFITPLYAVLAGLIGVYLGLAMDVGEQRSLLTPMIIHGLYDYLAFLVVLKSFRAEKLR